MRTLDQHQSSPLRGSHRTRFFWAGTWYAITLAAWLSSWGMERLGPSSAAALTSLAFFSELVSVALRWKSITQSDAPQLSSSDKTATELLWLCAWGAQANTLGLVAMLSPDLVSMLPALIVTAGVEALVLSKAPLARKATGERVAREIVSESELATASPVIELEYEHWTRSTHEGRTEAGERFLSGWVRFSFAADQKTLTLTVGFSPAFSMAPEVELDQEVDSEESHCEALVEHVTPAGMRVAMKRSSTGAPLSGKLLWHASESDHSPAPLLSSRLP